MKLAYMLMFLVILQMSIMLFDGTFDESSYNLNPYNSTTNVNNTQNHLWNFVTDPTGWTNTGFLIFLAGIISTASLIGVGAAIFYKSDTALLFGVFLFFMSLGSIPIISLYNLINRNPAMWGCVSTPCLPSILVWVFSGGILAVFYIMSCVSFWTGRPAT